MRHFDPIEGRAHLGRPENCEDMACREKARADKEIGMGIRGIKSPEEVAEEQRAKRKDELIVQARDKNNLSWTVRSVSPYQVDRWPCINYRAVEQNNGSLWIVDDDSDTCVRIYPAGLWTGMHLEYQEEPGHIQDPWVEFLPHQAYLKDLADRLIKDAKHPDVSGGGVPYPNDGLPTEDPE